MAKQIYTVPGSSLELETVQDYINYDIYSNVIEPSAISASYTCHICTVSMPLSSVSAHLASYIHRMWLTVAEQAAERLNRQASVPKPLFQPLPPDTVLCQTCGVLVEDNHTCPKKYTAREKTLTKFLEIYQNTVAEDIEAETRVDDDVPRVRTPNNVLTNSVAEDIAAETPVDDDVPRVRTPNNVLTNSTENESNASENDVSGVEAELDIDVGAVSKTSNVVIDNEIDGEPSASTNEVPYADDNSHIDTSYIENRYIRNQITKRENISEEEIQMLKYYEYLYEDQEYTHNILVHNAEYVDIVTPIGDCVRVTEDNYHGFYTVNGETLCRVCRYLVRDKNVHMRTEDHMNRIRCPLTDQNCVRQINLLWNHCVLCNEIIENVEYHVMCSETHEAALSNALIAPGCLPVPDDGSTETELVECKICSETLEKENLRDHAASSAHKKQLQEKRLQLRDEDPISNHHHLQKRQGRLRCRVCNIELDEDTEIIANHLDSKNHKDLYEVILLQDRIEQVQSKFECQVCAVDLTAENILQHVANEDHVKNIRELHFGLQSKRHDFCTYVQPVIKLNEVYAYFTIMYYNKFKVWCKVCLVILNNITEVMIDHRYEQKHIKQYNLKLKANKIDKFNNMFYCQVCNVTIMGFMQEVDHWLSKAHKFKLSQFERLANASTAQQFAPNTLNSKVSTGTVSDQTVAETGVFYYNGNKSMEIRPRVTDKNESFTYYNPIVPQLVKNKLLIFEENWMTCKICDVSFSNWYTHLRYDHDSYFYDYLSKNNICCYRGEYYECKTCALMFESDTVIDHITKMNHQIESYVMRIKTPVIAYEDALSIRLLYVLSNGIEVYCKICKIIIPNSNRDIFDHLKEHRTKEDDSNKISKEGEIDHLAEFFGMKLNLNE